VQAQQRGSGFRRFVQTPYGRAALPAATILIVFGTYVYVSTLLAIPAILVFGLAIPIWGGLKRPRYLALSGLVIILIVAPISSAALVQEIRQPIGAVSSSPSLPDGNGGAVLANAGVSPYTGTTSTNFTWQVTIQPQYIPAGNNATPVAISLFVSSCPGATSNATTYCPSGFSFYNLSYPHKLTNLSETIEWNFTIGANGIWDWQMEIWVVNTTTHTLNDILLQGDPTYNGIEGPVVGSWWDTYGQIVPTLYLNDLLLLGLPFYLVLVLYMFFKRRERNRKDAQRRAAGPAPPDSGGPAAGSSTPAGPPPPSASAAAQEQNCPNCGAVIYAGEKSCWKCGAQLGGPPKDTPLPSAPKG